MIRTTSLVGIRCSRSLIRFQHCRNIQTIKNSVPNRRAKPEVIINEGDFTKYGILPFLQGKLNDFVNPTLSGIVEDNTEPTTDQQKLLTVLQSEYSFLQRGTPQTGKTLGLITYLLNVSFTRIPNYRYISTNEGYDSIILVPTSYMVDKYKSIMKFFIAGLPQEPCPGELTLKDKTAKDREYTLSRIPLAIDFLSKSSTDKISTLETSQKSQILVTTILKLEEIVHGKSDISSDKLHNLKTIAVDDFDLFLKTTDIDGEDQIEVYGAKEKYKTKLHLILKAIQANHINDFKLQLKTRLDTTKREHEDGENLEARLTKESRRVFYKPIQYCFVGNSNEAHKQMLLEKSYIKKVVRKNVPRGSLQKSIERLQIEKYQKSELKADDNQNAFVEAVIRFDDEQRELKKTERPLIKAGNYSVIDCNSINTYVTVGVPKLRKVGKSTIYDVEINKELLVSDLMNKHLRIAVNNIKNYEKFFLRYRQKTEVSLKDTALVLKQIIQKFKKTSKNSNPSVIVIPTSYDATDFTSFLNGKHSTEPKFILYSSSVKPIENTCTIMTASQIIGQDLAGYPNMFIVGLDSCLHLTALSKKKTDNILGIHDPVGSLIPYFISKLNLSTQLEKNIVFAIINKESLNLDHDLKKLNELLQYNEIPRLTTPQSLSDKVWEKPVEIDSLFAAQLKSSMMRAGGKKGLNN